MNIDDILAKAEPARRTVRVCIRGDLSGRIETLRERWAAAVQYDADRNAPATAPALWDEIAALEREAEAATVAFVVEAVGSTLWRRLVAEHPPPPDDLEGWRWNLETFPPAALAASAVEPAMTEEQAAALADKLSNGQWQKLFGAVLTVNIGDDLVGKFATATDDHPSSEPNSPTAPPEESLTASS